MKKTATVFWDKGRYYFEIDQGIRHWTMASMYRKAVELGFTHVSIVQAHRDGAGFVVDTIDQVECEPVKRKIPKEYRKEADNE